MSFDINILVNGTRCKLYNHRGKTFVEAKEGSEYTVEIKNNSWEKVLAVVSVDGLNVIDGKSADENGPGYVMDKYTAQKLYGFQYSPDKVATFKFGAMGAKDAEGNPLGYAASKKDGSEKNTGVIGVRIWDEIPQQPPMPVTAISASWSGQMTVTTTMISGGYSPNPSSWNAGGLYGPFGYTYSGDSSAVKGQTNYKSLFGRCAESSTGKGNFLREAITDAKAVRATALANPKSTTIPDGQNAVYSCQVQSLTPDEPLAIAAACCSPAQAELDMASFDMETQWGNSRFYKVKETTFERREVIHSFDIYYASRESLIAMGIDLGTERRVSFPESFKESKYAKPPKGWRP